MDGGGQIRLRLNNSQPKIASVPVYLRSHLHRNKECSLCRQTDARFYHKRPAYANGSIHLGHMLEYIQTDIWVRYQKQSGHQCVCVRR